MKILLIAGHGAGDPGASGCGYQEAKLTRDLVNIIAPKLRVYATVDVYDQTRNAYYDCQNGTFKIGNYDYVLEVHFNAFNGSAYGTEIYVTDREKGTTVEQAIMRNLSKYFSVRGVKVTNFLVINTVKDKGISAALLETCFIDNQKDMNKYQQNKNAIADSIVKGIVDEFGLKKGSKPTPKPTPKRHEDPNGVLYPGDKVCFNTVFTVDYLDVPNNRVCSKKMIGGKPTASYHWVDAGPCTEVNNKGSKAGDQVLYVGDKFRVDGDYKVLAIDIPTEATQLKIGKTTVWVKSAYLSKVTYK
ncbi:MULTISPECIES: N-acetylmuramoyl-L-alanine amidase [Bacillota]|jgi:hypothetical protein|uniref:N-acetylmuramoyl-L-alanine amidase n=1 Tax=Bacillota TaxID=1239 RepID=UPI000E421BBF|nr:MULTISPECIES: N-acetylmuramoyl-L-alanine amidase [Bacillota]RGB58610.1 N-acetylmuramoyl-L-alanine amidase [Absiella sp. AM22-9]DAY77826.1 MAG TPA: Cell wall hydrolase autolysin [Caudoviricetes sp.]